MSSFLEIFAKSWLHFSYMDFPGSDATLFSVVESTVEEWFPQNNTFLVKCSGTRNHRWRKKDKWLSMLQLREDVILHDGDGFAWSLENGHRLPSLAQRQSGRPWRLGSVMTKLSSPDEERLLQLRILKAVQSVPNFGVASILDAEYYDWMNCTSPDLYQRDFGRAKELPLKIWKLPPTDTAFIDNSLFPGRSQEVTRNEALIPVGVASHMWLGPEFWKIASCTREVVKAQDWLKWEEWEHDVLYIHCWPEPFNRPDGEQGELQKKLWRLLFDQDCHWPLPDGVGGPGCGIEQPPLLVDSKPIATDCPPQMATAIFQAKEADLAQILRATDKHLVAEAIHRGHYQVLATGGRYSRWKWLPRSLSLDEVIADVALDPADGLVLRTSEDADQMTALVICPKGLPGTDPDQLIVRLVGPAGNPRWTPYYGAAWTTLLAELPGFSYAWMGDVETETGLTTPPETEAGALPEGSYWQDLLTRPDRWLGNAIGSTIWAPIEWEERAKSLGLPCEIFDRNGRRVSKIEAWPQAFGKATSASEEQTIQESLVRLITEAK